MVELEIVLLPLLLVREYGVCLVYLFELIGRLFIAGVKVGVLLLCKLAVSRLYFVLSGIAPHS